MDYHFLSNFRRSRFKLTRRISSEVVSPQRPVGGSGGRSCRQSSEAALPRQQRQQRQRLSAQRIAVAPSFRRQRQLSPPPSRAPRGRRCCRRRAPSLSSAFGRADVGSRAVAGDVTPLDHFLSVFSSARRQLRLLAFFLRIKDDANFLTWRESVL